VVAGTGAFLGLAVFGGGPLVTLSGTQLPFWAGAGRLVLVCLYLTACLAGLGPLGMFRSTLTEQPIGATIAPPLLAGGAATLGWDGGGLGRRRVAGEVVLGGVRRPVAGSHVGERGDGGSSVGGVLRRDLRLGGLGAVRRAGRDELRPARGAEPAARPRGAGPV